MLKLFTIILLSNILYAKQSGHLNRYTFTYYQNKYNNFEISIKDYYSFFYNSNDKECKLSKNGKIIELFDPRFNKKAPKVKSYRCAAMIKEKYSKCEIANTETVSSVALGFGKDRLTNLRIGFNVYHHNLDATVEVECRR